VKVYCDRLATVTITRNGRITCPKCEGECVPSTAYIHMWNCVRCGRGWERVPDRTANDSEAEEFLIRKHDTERGRDL
jgi:hypothetical protein